MSAVAAVQLSGVAKAYGRGDTLVHALRGVDLEVLPGELMMLVGPSGCGKTTLLSVAAGILDHDAGACRVFGQDIGGLSDRELVRFRGRTLGFVFQSFNLVPALSAAENVAVPLFLQGVPRREAVRRAGEMLERVGLGDRGRALPRELSGGQQQRVAIARAVIHRPRLVVCDEPTSALDQETGHRVMELLRSLLLGDGRSLLVVTHDSRIFPFADRIAHMNDGRIDRVESARVPQGGPA
jgi:putative ABC transport system ATP-binding protein